MSKSIKIGNRLIGPGHPCFIIAEMSANHEGDFNRALEIIHAAKAIGADAIKLQTYRADTITLNSDRPDFLIPADSPWSKQTTLYSLYEKAHTPWEWHADLFEEAEKCGLEIFSSPFDASAVDFLESLNTTAYKVASPEITDIPLLQKIGRTGKPVFMSTGLATEQDLDLAVKVLRAAGSDQVILLKCTTAYPAPIFEANLHTIPDMAQKFDCLAGLSDHTPGSLVPIVAIAVGAVALEKHFVLTKESASLDAFFSLDVNEFQQMVRDVRAAESALGGVSYEISPSSLKSLRGRRSLYVCDDVKKGDVLSEQNIKSVRPAFGLHPKHMNDVCGRRAKQDLKRGDRLSWDLID